MTDGSKYPELGGSLLGGICDCQSDICLIGLLCPTCLIADALSVAGEGPCILHGARRRTDERRAFERD